MVLTCGEVVKIKNYMRCSGKLPMDVLCTVRDGDKVVAFVGQPSGWSPASLGIESIRSVLPPNWKVTVVSTGLGSAWNFFPVVHRSDYDRRLFERVQI